MLPADGAVARCLLFFGDAVVSVSLPGTTALLPGSLSNSSVNSPLLTRPFLVSVNPRWLFLDSVPCFWLATMSSVRRPLRPTCDGLSGTLFCFGLASWTELTVLVDPALIAESFTAFADGVVLELEVDMEADAVVFWPATTSAVRSCFLVVAVPSVKVSCSSCKMLTGIQISRSEKPFPRGAVTSLD